MCSPRSAIALPSQAGGGQRSTAASDAAADAVRGARHVPPALCSRSPKPSWRRAAPQGSIRCRCRRVAIARDEQATCAPQLLSLAALAEGSSARQQRVPPLTRMRCDRARQARHVSSAPCSRSPQPHWRRTAPQGSAECRRRRNASKRDQHALCRPHSAVALPAELAAGSAARQHQVPPPARRDHARRSRHAPSALCS